MFSGVTWIDGALGSACFLVGAFHIGLVLAGRSPFAPAAAHAVMGIGMAAMFVPAADLVPPPLWVAVFLVVAAWFGAESIRAGSLLGDAGHHTVGAVAMLFMLLSFDHGAAAPPGSVDSGHAHGAGGSAPPLLLSAIAVVLAAWFITEITRRFNGPATDLPPAPVIRSVAARTTTRSAAGRSARAEVARRAMGPAVLMSAAMSVMLLGMV